MDEEHFLASLKCLNNDSLEDYYQNSLTSFNKMSLQMTIFKLLAKDYSPQMVIYAVIVAIFMNIKGFLFPGKQKEIPEALTKKLPSNNWYQTNLNNSAIVAVIKAVQARYKDDIFKKSSSDLLGNYNIVLKDDVEVYISHDEIDFVKLESQFKGPETKSKQNAYIAYAAIVKNAVLRKEFPNFKSALAYFNSGSTPEYCVELLGYLRDMMIVEPMRGLHDIVIAYSSSHAICINNGFVEGYGEKLIFAGHDTMGKMLDKAIMIR